MDGSVGGNADRAPASNRVEQSRPDQLPVLHPPSPYPPRGRRRRDPASASPGRRPGRRARPVLRAQAFAATRLGPIDLLVVAIGIAAAFYLKYRNRRKYESAGRLITEGLRTSVI